MKCLVSVLMEQLGITRSRLGDLLDISRQRVTQLFQQETDFSFGLTLRMLMALKVEIEGRLLKGHHH